jgi:uncharacterized membrane protein
MTQEHPVVERYMAHFEHSIKDFDFPEPQEVAHEIRNHIAEACAAGKHLDAVLQSLGPADVLARAYAVELLLNRRASRRIQKLNGFLKVAGLVAVTSFATFVVVGILGTVGIGFTASGVAIITIGVLEQAGIHLPGVQMNGIAPVWAIVLGLSVMVIGVVSLLGLRLYIRFLTRTLKTFRRVSGTASSLA